MKIVVIGGTGLIGSRVVTELAERGHEAVAASPNSGVRNPRVLVWTLQRERSRAAAGANTSTSSVSTFARSR